MRAWSGVPFGFGRGGALDIVRGTGFGDYIHAWMSPSSRVKACTKKALSFFIIEVACDYSSSSFRIYRTIQSFLLWRGLISVL